MNNTDSQIFYNTITRLILKTSNWWKMTLCVCIAVCIAGIIALYKQISIGHIVTGMRDNVVWGIYIVDFIFFMGLSYAGALISGVLFLLKPKWRKPIIRIAEIMTVVSLLIGPVFILLCVGRFDRLHFLILYPRIQSPITWDIIAISTDIIGCVLFLYLSVLEDMAILRDDVQLILPKWKKRIYKFMAIGYKATTSQKRHLTQARNVMSVMIIALTIIVYSVLAWIFGVTLQPGWHSTIFGPYFVIAAVFSGTGLMIIIMWIVRKICHLEQYITIKHFENAGYLLIIIGAFYGYFTFADYLTKWYGSQKMDALLIDKLFTNYYWAFIFANFIGILVPIIITGIPRFRTINSIFASAVITFAALWVNRFLIVVPTLENPYLPIQDYRPAWTTYSSTWVEWTLTASGISVYIILFILIFKIVPVISISEMSGKK